MIGFEWWRRFCYFVGVGRLLLFCSQEVRREQPRERNDIRPVISAAGLRSINSPAAIGHKGPSSQRNPVHTQLSEEKL